MLTAFLPLMLLGCGPRADGEHWSEQLQPGGPCWTVQLGDGLSEESTDELHQLFDCFNQHQNFDPLTGLINSMDAPGRTGASLGISLAEMVNALPTLGIDPFGLAGQVVSLFDNDPQLITDLFEVYVELLYGQPYIDIDEPSWSGSALDQGIIRPALPLLSASATVVVDEQLTGEIASLLTSPTADAGLCLLVGLDDSTDPDVSRLAQQLLPDFGKVINAAQQADNDIWPDASGHSIADLTTAFLLNESNDGLSIVDAIRPDVLTMLGDEGLKNRILTALEDMDRQGHLDPFPVQLLYLASVDAQGGTLSAGEDSALYALLRMLHAANQPLECSVSVLGLSLLDVELDNLSVEILRNLSQQDPDNVAGALDVLGGALGWGLTQTVLDAVVDSEVCPLLTDQLVDDLDTINRLSDPEAADLLVVMLELLQALHPDDSSDENLTALVSTVSSVHARGGVNPLEELLRDVADSAFVDDLTDLIAVMFDPSDLPTDACPAQAEPLDLSQAWDAVAVGLESGGAFDQFNTVLQLWLGQSVTWTILDNAGDLLMQDHARSQSVLSLLGRINTWDAEGLLRENVEIILEQPAVYTPALHLLEAQPLQEALAAAELTQEGPLPFSARLVTGGTLESVLRTVDLLIDMLRNEESPNE